MSRCTKAFARTAFVLAGLAVASSCQRVERRADGCWLVDGVGVGGLGEPENVLDVGNSGTSARLLLGILATHPFTAFVTGDASLRTRPMGRVITPLSHFGAQFRSREGGRLPLAVTGAANPVPTEYRLPVPSAQVKSAVLLAGLNTPGLTTVIEKEPTRDHTERLLGHFGARVTVGHQAILHGCTIADDCLIGMGARILNGAVLESECLVGAGALITEGKRFAGGSLIRALERLR